MSAAVMFVHVSQVNRGVGSSGGNYGLAAGSEKIGLWGLGVRPAVVGELVQQVVVGLEAGRGDLAVGQPGEADAVHVVGHDTAVGVGGGLGAVVVQDVGQDLQGGGLALLGRVATGVFQDLRPRLQVVGHVVGGLAGVEQVL